VLVIVPEEKKKKKKKKRLLLLLLMVVMAAASGARVYILDLFSKWRESCSSCSDHEVALGWLLLSGGRLKLLVL
jgi:flagellar basal body-associated protein FliL